MSEATKPLRLRAPVVPEDALQASVVEALAILVCPPAEWTCFPAGNVQLPPQAAAKLSRLGLRRGWPDLLIVSGGRVYGIELKRDGGQLSKTRTVRTKRGALRVLDGQADVFPRLESAGMAIAVCRSVQDVVRALHGWNIPMRGML